MNPGGFQLRRATSDDVPALMSMWRRAGLDAESLEPAFTEFQLAVDVDGEPVAGIALKIHQGNGLLHGECLPDFSLADQLRPLLWERVLQVATNHGLDRIWTQETAPFWRQLEFVPPEPAQIEQLPESFRIHPGEWRVLPLKNEADLKRIDRELNLFLQEGRAKAEEMKSKGRLIYGLAILIALAVFGFVIVLAVRVLRRGQADLPAPRPAAAMVLVPARPAPLTAAEDRV